MREQLVVRCLLAEIDLALALTGCPSIADITPDLLASTGWSADQRTS